MEGLPAPPRAVAAVHELIAREPRPPGVSDGVVDVLSRLCGAAVRALPASGAGVSVMVRGGTRGFAVASDASSEVVEELQFVLGEGPCIDAFREGRPVLEPDLGSAGARWPGYSPAARSHGVRAVFAFPLRSEGASLGVFDVYRDAPGRLSGIAVAQAATFAEVALATLLDGMAEGGGPGGTVAALDERDAADLGVYQAQGMVMVQLGVGLDEAMARLRAFSYAQDRRLRDVARDVVARRLRLDQDDPG